MAKLVSMEMDAEEASEEGAPADADPPKYSYGTRISLDDSLIEKLGLTDCKVGDVVTIQAKGRVISYSESEQRDGDEECRCEIQITHMAIEAGGADKEKKADDRLNELSGTKGRDY